MRDAVIGERSEPNLILGWAGFFCISFPGRCHAVVSNSVTYKARSEPTMHCIILVKITISK